MKKLLGWTMVLGPIVGLLTFGFMFDAKATWATLASMGVAVAISLVITTGVLILMGDEK